MGLLDFFKTKKNISSNDRSVHLSIESDIVDIVNKLEEIGYFKYAERNDLNELKKEVYSSLMEPGFLSTIWNENKPFNSKDYRHYNLDNEDLFEQGGFIESLKDFEYLFRAMAFNLTITNHVEDWDEVNDWVNHSLSINGKDYIIFKNFKGYGWGEAAQRFAEILNDQLNIQGKDERVYLSNGGNDGKAVVLTEAQFKLLDPILKHKNDRPLRIIDWCEVMQVDPMAYLQGSKK